MEIRETCSKCGFDAKDVSICPVLKTHHSLLTKSLFHLSREQRTAEKSKSPGTDMSADIKGMCRRSHIIMTAFSSLKTHTERSKFTQKVREIDRNESFDWANIMTKDIVESKPVNTIDPVRQSTSTDVLHSSVKKKTLNMCTIDTDSSEIERQRSRMERFAAPKRPAAAVMANTQPEPLDVEYQIGHESKIVGTLMTLEKPYFRLQEVPKPSDVRPIHVLKESFEFVSNKSQSIPGQKGKDYLNEQLKSIRQDLSIQQIENFFAISVYEAQARLSLELRDLVEFNQCQSRLVSLYAKMKKESSAAQMENETEFLFYRIVYSAIMQTDFGLCTEFYRLAEEQKCDSEVQYAIQLASAIAINNPAQIFNLFQKSTELRYGHWVRCLMRKLFEIKRPRWCITLFGTCGPKEQMTILDVVSLLAFHLESDESMRLFKAQVMNPIILQAMKFLASMNATIFNPDGTELQQNVIVQKYDDYIDDPNLEHFYIMCTDTAKQISAYISYCHTREDAKHAMKATGSL